MRRHVEQQFDDEGSGLGGGEEANGGHVRRQINWDRS